MRVSTTRFGELELEDSKIISMPDGMVGFSEQRFIILNPGKGGTFCWLQSVDNPGLAFVVVEPVRFFPEYHVKLTREEYDKLQLDPKDDMILLSVVTMAPDPQQITVNLQGPIVVNPGCMIARQLVLEGNHTTRHLLFPPPESALAGKTQQVAPPLALSRFSSLYSSNIGLALACA